MKLIAHTPLKLNGQRIAQGAEFEATAKEAEQLGDLASPAPTKKEKAASPAAPAA